MDKSPFAQCVAGYLELYDKHIWLLAAEFEVASSTVLSWARGSARPHPVLESKVMRWIGGQS